MPNFSCKLILFFTLFLGTILGSCTSVKPYYSSGARNWASVPPKDSAEIDYTIYLIGDVGAPDDKRQEPSLKLLQSHLEKESYNSTCVFLGDNIYYYGMNAEDGPSRREDERRLLEQMKVFQNYKGEKYFIPGNHDWANGRPHGRANVMRQEAFIEAQYPVTNTFVPDSSCPGPYEVLLYEDIALIALDSQWWLHPNDKPYGENNYCGVANELDFLVQLESLIQKHSDKHIMVVAHHPIYTNGMHGGFTTFRDHVFPLTMVRDWAYLPLPVIGSLYPLARKYGGIVQDNSHPRYKAYSQGLSDIFKKYPNIVFGVGHEHSLQYFDRDGIREIVSGSGCKDSYVAGGNGASYAHQTEGFAKVIYYKNGEAWVEFWSPGDKKNDGSVGEVTFRTSMYAKTLPDSVDYGPSVEYGDSTVTIAANPRYEAGGFKRFLLGDHYRQEWTTPITAPVISLASEKGGLKPYKIGGGKQTTSLKLRNQQGREYTLRLIKKDATRAIPQALRETIAEDVFDDQFSSQHPYAPLVIPALADAAGIYHTNPRLVYIPRDPRLGQWIDQFSNQLAYLEEDPDESHEEVASLANATKFQGTDKMLENLRQDNDARVDRSLFARSRLFDMLIGDWDRHEGQWRWALDKTGKGRLYKPVPEDRDIAFFKGDGFIPWFSRRKWAVRNLQHFGREYDDVIGLNLSGNGIDRTLLSGITRQEWIALANELKTTVSDQEIEDAVKQLPGNIYEISGQEIITKLKNRRDNLPAAAEEYYEALALDVDVVGTDKHERFEVNRLNDNDTEVIVTKITKEGEPRGEYYRRTFYRSETDEIRLYGLGGQDEFILTGEVDKGIKIRIIGGPDQDKITDNSKVSGIRHYTKVYDNTKDNNTISLGTESRDKTESVPEVNNYDRVGYRFPYVMPRISAAYNVDDGIFLGGGFTYRTFGFRKEPYATEHTFIANYALKTQAFNFRFEGDYRQVFGKWNLNLQASYLGPQYVFNYFGLGNETEPIPGHDLDKDIDFYRVKFTRLNVLPTLTQNIKPYFLIGVGPTYDFFEVQDTEGRFITTTEANVNQNVFDRNQFIGGRLFAQLGASTNQVNPRLGVNWYNEAAYNHGISGIDDKFTRLSSEFKFYWSPVIPFQATLAMRFGANTNIGDFPFYRANTLGGLTNLRGYRRTRYAGRSSIYQNTEVRVEVFKFNVYLFPGKFGVLGLVDHGRVYVDNENSDKIHRGVGGGIWVDILKQAVFTTTYSVGEENLFNVTFGFLF